MGKAIFLPVEPRMAFGGRLKIQGLFLQRQAEVSTVYSAEISRKLLCAENLFHALLHGPRSDKMFELVDKHVAKSMEDQAGYYKPMFLASCGAETWVGFRGGVCSEFRKSLP